MNVRRSWALVAAALVIAACGAGVASTAAGQAPNATWTDLRAGCQSVLSQTLTSRQRQWALDCVSIADRVLAAAPTTSPPAATTTVAPTTTTTTAPPPTTPPIPPPAGYPTPETTGVPAGTVFSRTVGTTTLTTPGEVVDGWHVTGSLIIAASGVVIRNTLVDDSVWNDNGSFTITDSTVGPASCGTPNAQPMGVGFQDYTATRVQVRGHEDGFRAAGPGVVIRDSYYLACAPTSAAHADGVQDYPSAPGIVVDHNTLDMRGAVGYTAPIFVHSTGTDGATITNNLVMGGVYSVYLNPTLGRWVVTGNRVLANSYAYGPYEAEGRCSPPGGMMWEDNDVVTLNGYAVTATTQDDMPCPG